jgi:osmotically-inducible protein OsmY
MKKELMKILKTLLIASPLLLAVGCAQNEKRYVFDESIAPTPASAVAASDSSPAISAPSVAGNGSSGTPATPGTESSMTRTDAATGQLTPTSRSETVNVTVEGGNESDRTLAKQITQDLGADTSLASAISQIKISLNEGKATLQGSVANEQQKRDIEAAVQRVAGVSGVDNQIEVGASQPATMDQQAP